MKGSFVYPGFDNENDDNNNKNNNYDEFDPQTDFSQFLEEAKRQAGQDMENNPIPEIGENKQVIIVDEEIKKSKKWWKTVLFSFWRSSSSDKKSKKHSTEILSSNNVNVTHTNKPQGYVSSPLYNPGNVAATSTGWSRLIGLFQPKKREDEETEIPYVSLNNKPTQDNTGVYGPVYLVS